MSDVLIVERADEWATLTMSRPDRGNALSIELRDAISDALDGLGVDPQIKAVVITGAGSTFSGGFDLKEFGRAAEEPSFGEQIWTSSDRYHHTLLTFPLPLIAAVNGPAMGGGFDTAVCCDVRIASTTARFAHPEFPFADMLYSPLEVLVGGAVARDLLLTGRDVDAETALRIDLVTELAAPDQLHEAVAATMARIVRAPRDQLRRTKAKAVRRAAVELVPTLQL